MLLAIDSGNTNIVFAVFDSDGKMLGKWRAASKQERTPDEFGVWLLQLMKFAGIKPEQIKSAIISSVVPSSMRTLKTLCRRYFSCSPLIVDEKLELGIDILLDSPETLGADRLVNAYEAYKSYGGSLIVVDFGTATTLDVVDNKGNYIGGSIAPGINLSIKALHQAASLLPKIAVSCPDKIIGKNTKDAMSAGVFWGYIGMIECLVRKTKEEYGSPMKVIATGGLAALFTGYTSVIDSVDENLTLKGLLKIYNKCTG